MQVEQLWRYPVKSLRGERLDHVEVETRGFRHDRRWAVTDPDGKLGSGKSSERFRKMPGLLELSAAMDGDVPVLTFPDGTALRGDEGDLDARLSEHVGRAVRLLAEDGVPHHDDGPVQLVTRASLDELGRALGHPAPVPRFRPNLVVAGAAEPFVERSWVGRTVTVGEVVLRVEDVTPRCVMVTQAQADLPEDRDVLRTVHAVNAGELGIWCTVVRPGTIHAGDSARIAP